MACATVATVVVLSVPGKEPSHDCRDTLLTAFKEDMSVGVHERPCLDGSARLNDLLTEALQEPDLVRIVIEDD